MVEIIQKIQENTNLDKKNHPHPWKDGTQLG
jgi:hypothetical protein